MKVGLAKRDLVYGQHARSQQIKLLSSLRDQSNHRKNMTEFEGLPVVLQLNPLVHDG